MAIGSRKPFAKSESGTKLYYDIYGLAKLMIVLHNGFASMGTVFCYGIKIPGIHFKNQNNTQ
jgi:ABC-type long-subunit fatty acid transport system fused permease/ATPase subunit